MGGNNSSKLQMDEKLRLWEAACRYIDIEDIVNNLTTSNVETESQKILAILADGKILLPKEQPSIFMRLLSDASTFVDSPSYISVLKGLLPEYQKSGLAVLEQPFSILINDFKIKNRLPEGYERPGNRSSSVNYKLRDPILPMSIRVIPDASIALRIRHEHCLSFLGKVTSLLQILAPLGSSLQMTRFLYELVKDWISYWLGWSSPFINILKSLICYGADPFQRLGEDTESAFVSLIKNAYSILFTNVTSNVAFLDLLKLMMESGRLTCSSQIEDGNTILHMAIQSLPCYCCRSPHGPAGHGEWMLSIYESLLSTVLNLFPELLDKQNDTNQSPLHTFVRITLSRDFSPFAEKYCLCTVISYDTHQNPAQMVPSRFNSHDKAIIIPFELKGQEKLTHQLLSFINNIVPTLATASNLDLQDENGSSVVHELLEGIEIFSFMTLIFIRCADTLIEVLSKLLTKKNVNMVDKYMVTPYSWVLMWKETVNDPEEDIPISQARPTNVAVSQQFSKLERLFKTNNANTKLAKKGLKVLRGRQLSSAFVHTFAWFDDYLERLLKKTKVLVKKGKPECLTCPFFKSHVDLYFQEQLYLYDSESRKFATKILEAYIDKSNAQEFFDIFSKCVEPVMKNNALTMNYFVIFDALCLCLAKGAVPSKDVINNVMLLAVKECESSDTIPAVYETAERLIQAYRKHGNTEVIECFLNPLQNLYLISNRLQQTACKLIQSAYNTLENCMKSGSVINILLFLSADIAIEYPKHNINECFQQIQALMEAENKNPHAEFAAKKVGRVHVCKPFKDLLVSSNENWLQRSVLHLTVIFCNNEDVLQNIPTDILDNQVNKQDLHGCTPLHSANLHQNKAAVTFLKSIGATEQLDFFGVKPESANSQRSRRESLNEAYQKLCVSILETRTAVLNTMKPLLLMPTKEREEIPRVIKQLFESLVEGHPAEIQVKIAGSLRERLKVGQLNEVDIQLYFKYDSFIEIKTASADMHRFLVKRLRQISWEKLPVRPISVQRPWKFIWEGTGPYNQLVISVDVFPFRKTTNVTQMIKSYRKKQMLILDQAKEHPYHEFLKWNDFMSQRYLFRSTTFQYEWDVLDSLPPGCRLGILIAKALLEAVEQKRQNRSYIFVKKPITSYDVKNTLFWLLSGLEFENLISCLREQASCWELQLVEGKLPNNPDAPKWMDEDDLEKYKEQGRYWAHRIISLILGIAMEREMILASYFNSQNQLSHLNNCQINEIMQIGEIVRERLRPEVFLR